jgi:hypothetical protein
MKLFRLPACVVIRSSELLPCPRRNTADERSKLLPHGCQSARLVLHLSWEDSFDLARDARESSALSWNGVPPQQLEFRESPFRFAVLVVSHRAPIHPLPAHVTGWVRSAVAPMPGLNGDDGEACIRREIDPPFLEGHSYWYRGKQSVAMANFLDVPDFKGSGSSLVAPRAFRFPSSWVDHEACTQLPSTSASPSTFKKVSTDN